MIRVLSLSALLTLALCGCGSHGPAAVTHQPAAPSAQDIRSARGVTTHEDAFRLAYGRWDKAYAHPDRVAFLRISRRQRPIMEREAESMYRSAIGADDPAIRTQYVALATTFLDQASAIRLIEIAVTRSDQKQFASAVHALDRARRRTFTATEHFVTAFQRRFGYNPFGVK